MHERTYLSMYAWTYVFKYVRMYICAYVRMYVLMHVDLHVHVYNTHQWKKRRYIEQDKFSETSITDLCNTLNMVDISYAIDAVLSCYMLRSMQFFAYVSLVILRNMISWRELILFLI
jgi:hypothetical protein